MSRGFALFAGTSVENIRTVACEAERLGYGSFWLNHPGRIDGIAALSHAAESTEGIQLGIGVIPLHTRGPQSIVEGCRAAKLPLDRLLLGVGSPNPDSLRRMRDGVAALRPQIAARIIVAALGPRMCNLAGQIADGVLFNWLTPEHAGVSAEWVREGAAAAGRQPPPLYAYVRVALGAAGRDKLVEEGERYAAIPAYRAHFERMVVQPIQTCIGAGNPSQIETALDKWQSVVDHVVIRCITAGDTVGENLELVRAAAPRVCL